MRPDIDTYFTMMAMLVASRGTCIRRQVGCVLVDAHNRVLATGYNGVPSGFTHCIDRPCLGASCKSGQGLDLCEAIHGEQNALLQCRDKDLINAAFCTTAPCVHCVKLLLNTPCRSIIFDEDYPHSAASKELWERGGREWRQHVSPA